MVIKKHITYPIIFVTILAANLSFAEGKKNLNQRSQERAIYSTNIDFDSTIIDGQMKAPTGFFLQGRNKQSLSNMVKLRSNFNQRLENSRTAVKALVR